MAGEEGAAVHGAPKDDERARLKSKLAMEWVVGGQTPSGGDPCCLYL